MTTVSRTGGEAVVETLAGAGVSRIFGVPGESFLGLLDAFRDGPITFVSTRHEGGASFMASGYARLANEVAVCIGTRAVGAANMAIGIHNAFQDSLPMIAIAGQVNRPFRDREAFQELRLADVFAGWCKWTVEIDDPARVPELMQRALDVARSGRPGPVFVALPQDVCDEHAEMEPRLDRSTAARPQPDPLALELVLEALAAAESPLIVVGGGIPGTETAADALVRLAELLEVPVITGWRRHDGFPNDHRLFLGSASLGAPPCVWSRMQEADVMLAIGTRFPENATRGYTLPARHTRLFQIDIEPESMTGHLSPELSIQSDAAAAVDALLASRLRSGEAADTRRRARNDRDRARFAAATELPPARETHGRVAYQAVLKGLADVLPADAVISTDAGNFYAWISRYFRFRRPSTYLGPASGAMGYGLPAAIGGQMARPSTPVICVAGDGGFGMTMQELQTAARLRVPVVALVLDNQRHGTIRMHQEAAFPGRPVGTELGEIDFVAVAEGLGAAGLRVTSSDEVVPALEHALEQAGPTVIHALMDREQLSCDLRLESDSALEPSEDGATTSALTARAASASTDRP